MFATRLIVSIVPLVEPTAASALLVASACRTSAGLIPWAARASGFSQTRIANTRPPKMSARCTPLTEERAGWTIRLR